MNSPPIITELQLLASQNFEKSCREACVTDRQFGPFQLACVSKRLPRPCSVSPGRSHVISTNPIKVQPQPAPPDCGFSTSVAPKAFGAVNLQVLRYHYKLVMISKTNFSAAKDWFSLCSSKCLRAQLTNPVASDRLRVLR